MQIERRNDKEHQRQRFRAYSEAQQTVAELHKLLNQAQKNRVSVGETVKVAARMGLLRREASLTR